jgi:hypothetical protein
MQRPTPKAARADRISRRSLEVACTRPFCKSHSCQVGFQRLCVHAIRSRCFADDSVRLVMSGKFLPYKFYDNELGVPEYGFGEEQ